jgi:hypothetical protein
MKDKRALELLREGLLQKACGALTQSAPVAATPEIVREMEAKHPQARETEPSRLSHLRPINAAAASQVDRERLLDALRSFPKGSAGGPCGLRPQHLKDALVAGWADEVVRHLTDLVNLLARGEAAVEVQQWLCGASLAALPKPAGDHRPVAVGETLRRLTSKALASMHSDEARIFLEPVQVGVGTKSGCEAIVHTVRQWMVRNKNSADKVLVKVDLSNAFNCVDRSAVLDAVRLVSPGLAPWCDFCYTRSSRLLFGAHTLDSERGIQQGDPLGPALFGLSIQGCILRAKSRTCALHPNSLDFVVFFLDDGFIAGGSEAVACFCSFLKEELSEIGLTLEFSKCEVVPAAGVRFAGARDMFGEFSWEDSGNFKLLGAPIGSAEFCNDHTRKRTEKVGPLFKAIRNFHHVQGGLLFATPLC